MISGENPYWGKITFRQAAHKLTAGAVVEAEALPADAATAVATISHMLYRDGITQREPWLHSATWDDEAGEHVVSMITLADRDLVKTAIAYRQDHPDLQSVQATRNFLIDHGHFPDLKPYPEPTPA